MKFNLFNKNLQLVRENFVKEFRYKNEVKLTPCDKFVACLNKLTQNYSLALKDTSAETMQVASHTDIEFYEGYELMPNYTDSVRKKLCESLKKSYVISAEIINSLNVIEKLDNDRNNAYNDTKLNINVINNIILNIYQYISMTDDVIEVEFNNDRANDLKKLLEYIKNLILQLVDNLTNISAETIIDFVISTIDNIIAKLLNYYNMLNM